MKTARLLISFSALLAAAACGAPDPTSPLAPTASARRDGSVGGDVPTTLGKGPGGMGSGFRGRGTGSEPVTGTGTVGGGLLAPMSGVLPEPGVLTDGPGGMGSGYSPARL
jgi:hypothetical protein